MAEWGERGERGGSKNDWRVGDRLTSTANREEKEREDVESLVNVPVAIVRLSCVRSTLSDSEVYTTVPIIRLPC